jgi:tetratricopeptide (TPR) repeat protein
MLACLYTTQGRARQALPLWQRASLQEPQNVWVWCGLGDCYELLGRPAQAVACYSACIALNPTSPTWFCKCGLAQLEQKEYAQSCANLDRALQLRPEHDKARLNRALARLGLQRHREALADLDYLIDRGADGRVYLLRAQVREKLGETAGAREDRAVGLRLEPTDEAGWLARGVRRLTQEPQAALADFNEALRLNPRSLRALENKAHVLAEKLERPKEAIDVLSAAVSFQPEYAPVRAARGTLLARLGKRPAALADARAALALDRSPALLFQVAGIYALTSQQHAGDRTQAIALLTAAVRDRFGHDLLRTDRDLDPLREDPRFGQLLQAVQVFDQGARAARGK